MGIHTLVRIDGEKLRSYANAAYGLSVTLLRKVASIAT
jgi:hypothetical protein